MDSTKEEYYGSLISASLFAPGVLDPFFLGLGSQNAGGGAGISRGVPSGRYFHRELFRAELISNESALDHLSREAVDLRLLFYRSIPQL